MWGTRKSRQKVPFLLFTHNYKHAAGCFVLISFIGWIFFLKLKKKTIGHRKINETIAKGEGICGNVCGVYDLIYESKTLVCVVQKNRQTKWNEANATYKLTHSHMYAHIHIQMNGSLLDCLIEILVLKENDILKKIVMFMWNWTKLKCWLHVCIYVYVWMREWMTLARATERICCWTRWVCVRRSRTYGWASEEVSVSISIDP